MQEEEPYVDVSVTEEEQGQEQGQSFGSAWPEQPQMQPVAASASATYSVVQPLSDSEEEEDGGDGAGQRAQQQQQYMPERHFSFSSNSLASAPPSSSSDAVAYQWLTQQQQHYAQYAYYMQQQQQAAPAALAAPAAPVTPQGPVATTSYAPAAAAAATSPPRAPATEGKHAEQEQMGEAPAAEEEEQPEKPASTDAPQPPSLKRKDGPHLGSSSEASITKNKLRGHLLMRRYLKLAREKKRYKAKFAMQEMLTLFTGPHAAEQPELLARQVQLRLTDKLNFLLRELFIHNVHDEFDHVRSPLCTAWFAIKKVKQCVIDRMQTLDELWYKAMNALDGVSFGAYRHRTTSLLQNMFDLPPKSSVNDAKDQVSPKSRERAQMIINYIRENWAMFTAVADPLEELLKLHRGDTSYFLPLERVSKKELGLLMKRAAGAGQSCSTTWLQQAASRLTSAVIHGAQLESVDADTQQTVIDKRHVLFCDLNIFLTGPKDPETGELPPALSPSAFRARCALAWFALELALYHILARPQSIYPKERYPAFADHCRALYESYEFLSASVQNSVHALYHAAYFVSCLSEYGELPRVYNMQLHCSLTQAQVMSVLEEKARGALFYAVTAPPFLPYGYVSHLTDEELAEQHITQPPVRDEYEHIMEKAPEYYAKCPHASGKSKSKGEAAEGSGEKKAGGKKRELSEAKSSKAAAKKPKSEKGEKKKKDKESKPKKDKKDKDNKDNKDKKKKKKKREVDSEDNGSSGATTTEQAGDADS